jgi:hypothetical protein
MKEEAFLYKYYIELSALGKIQSKVLNTPRNPTPPSCHQNTNSCLLSHPQPSHPTLTILKRPPTHPPTKTPTTHIVTPYSHQAMHPPTHPNLPTTTPTTHPAPPPTNPNRPWPGFTILNSNRPSYLNTHNTPSNPHHNTPFSSPLYLPLSTGNQPDLGKIILKVI